MRAEFLIEKLGELHLIAEAYRRQSDLPEALRADVRVTVGWSMTREALLTEPQAPRVRDRWMVLATVNELQPDKLRRLETWLARSGRRRGAAICRLDRFRPRLARRRHHLFGGRDIRGGAGLLSVGVPLRAVIKEQIGSAAKNGRWPAPQSDVSTALDDYEARLAARPWLGDWPLAVHDAIVVRSGDGLVLTHAAGGGTLPIKAREDDMVLPLIGVAGIDAFGLWDGRRLDLKFAETPLGRWLSA